MRLPIGFLIFLMGLFGIVFMKKRPKNNSKRKDVVRGGFHTSQNIASGVTVELWRFEVPAKTRLILTDFGNYINETDAWGLITWRFKRNGVAVYPYSNIEDQLGYASQLASLEGVECTGGDLFVIEATNNYGDVVKVGIVLKYQLCGET